jgi:hypothetical protein
MKRALLALAVVVSAVPAGAQCSLCKLAVEQDASLGTAFNKAIILMMIPALAVFAGVFILAIRSAPDSPQEDTKSNKESAAD